MVLEADPQWFGEPLMRRERLISASQAAG